MLDTTLSTLVHDAKPDGETDVADRIAELDGITFSELDGDADTGAATDAGD